MASSIVSNCTICSKEFKPKKGKSGKYCSLACYRTWQRSPYFISGRPKRYSGKCSNCDSDVYGKSHGDCRDGSKSDKIFCDRACYDSYRVKIRKEYIRDNKKKCKGCEAMIAPVSKGGNTPEYCGMECKRQHKKPKPQKCVNCECVFSAIKWFKGRKKATRVSGSKTCGAECHNLWIRNDPERKKKISIAFQGDKHPNWQGGPADGRGRAYRGAGWTRIRKQIRERDKYTCQDCGISEKDHGRNLEVHHRIPFGQFCGNNSAANKPSNLTALCKSCHTTADWKWRKDNPIQLGLSLHEDLSGPVKPKFPSDLTGCRVNNVRVTGLSDADHNSKVTLWKYDCLRCGGSGEAWRPAFVQGKINDCGCGKRGRIYKKWEDIRKNRASKWNVHGVPYDRAEDAAIVHGVSGSTIAIWCKGRESKSTGKRPHTKAVDGRIPPRDECWYGPPLAA